MSWYIYIVQCADGSLYTGITTDPRRRMREHVQKLPAGAKYTRSHPVTKLCALWSAETKSAALKLEARIKRLPAPQKQSLISAPERFDEILGEKLRAADYQPAPLFSLSPLLNEKSSNT